MLTCTVFSGPGDANQDSSKKIKFFSGLCLGLALYLSFWEDQKPLFKVPIHQSKWRETGKKPNSAPVISPHPFIACKDIGPVEAHYF